MQVSFFPLSASNAYAIKTCPGIPIQERSQANQETRHDLDALEIVLDKLCACQPLENRNHDHALSGNYVGFRECHIKPDWLLVYAIDGDQLILTASRTGTHSDLFQE